MKIPGALAALCLAVCVAGSARADLLTFGYGNARLGADPAPGGIGVASARRKIIPDCEASPDGEFGVTGTLVADRHAGRVYAVDVDGQAWALSLRTGRVADGWPVRVHPKGSDFVWSALTVSHGWLYVPVASLCDSGLYHGGVTAIRLNHPTDVRRWLTTGGTEAHAGGVWGWGGVSIDPRSGDVFAATGNSIGTTREDDGDAESVVRLSPTLVLEQSDHPLMPPAGYVFTG